MLVQNKPCHAPTMLVLDEIRRALRHEHRRFTHPSPLCLWFNRALWTGFCAILSDPDGPCCPDDPGRPEGITSAMYRGVSIFVDDSPSAPPWRLGVVKSYLLEPEPASPR